MAPHRLRSLLFLAVPLSLHAATYTNPVLGGDHPDPGVLYDPTSRLYYLTHTSGDAGTHYPIFSSPDLVTWTPEGAVFPPGAAGAPTWAASDYWAPEIHAFQGSYRAVFTARNKGGVLSVGIATAPTPTGPWTDGGVPVVTSANFSMGYIDATLWLEDPAAPWLVWKRDANDPAHCSGACPTYIYAAPLNADATALLPGSSWTVLLQQDAAWEGNLVEAPWLYRHNSTLYLFFSGSSYNNANYAVGVARSTSGTILGPWLKNPLNPVLHTASIPAGTPPYGPGHCSVVTDGSGGAWFVYHAWEGKNGAEGRSVLVDPVVWGADGWPVPAVPRTGGAAPAPP